MYNLHYAESIIILHIQK